MMGKSFADAARMITRNNIRLCGLAAGGVCAAVVLGGWDAAGAPPPAAPHAPALLAFLATDGSPDSSVDGNQ